LVGDCRLHAVIDGVTGGNIAGGTAGGGGSSRSSIQ
jgi:hypothetical protein